MSLSWLFHLTSFSFNSRTLNFPALQNRDPRRSKGSPDRWLSQRSCRWSSQRTRTRLRPSSSRTSSRPPTSLTTDYPITSWTRAAWMWSPNRPVPLPPNPGTMTGQEVRSAACYNFRLLSFVLDNAISSAITRGCSFSRITNWHLSMILICILVFCSYFLLTYLRLWMTSWLFDLHFTRSDQRQRHLKQLNCQTLGLFQLLKQHFDAEVQYLNL